MEQNLYGKRSCSSEIAAFEATLNDEGTGSLTERSALLPPGINLKIFFSLANSRIKMLMSFYNHRQQTTHIILPENWIFKSFLTHKHRTSHFILDRIRSWQHLFKKGVLCLYHLAVGKNQGQLIKRYILESIIYLHLSIAFDTKVNLQLHSNRVHQRESHHTCFGEIVGLWSIRSTCDQIFASEVKLWVLSITKRLWQLLKRARTFSVWSHSFDEAVNDSERRKCNCSWANELLDSSSASYRLVERGAILLSSSRNYCTPDGQKSWHL